MNGTEATPQSQLYLINLDQRDFQLFAWLLDSVEGLGCHSCTGRVSELRIAVPASQQEEWEQFIAAWREFRSQTPEDLGHSFTLTEIDP